MGEEQKMHAPFYSSLCFTVEALSLSIVLITQSHRILLHVFLQV